MTAPGTTRDPGPAGASPTPAGQAGNAGSAGHTGHAGNADPTGATATAANLDDARALVVRLDRTEFGIDVRHVREVLRPPEITRLPFPPPTILGIVSVRGALVPIMDLGARLIDTPSSRSGRLVVVHEDGNGSAVGLLVDEVLELVPLHGASHEPPAEVEASLPDGWIAGVLSPTEQRLVTLLDLSRVLDLPSPIAQEPR